MPSLPRRRYFGFNNVRGGLTRVVELLGEDRIVFHPAVNTPSRYTSHEARGLNGAELSERFQEGCAMFLGALE